MDRTDFCETHQKVVAFKSERLEDSWLRKAVLRAVALVVLAVMFLVPLYYTLKNMLASPADAREVY